MSNVNPTNPLFVIIRKGPRQNKTVTLPLNFGAALAGAGCMEGTPSLDQDASGVAVLSDGSKLFAGFITRDVLASVNGSPAVPQPTLSELATSGDKPYLPYESPFSAGFEGSLEDADEYEAEGPAFVSSGNGNRDVTNATAIGTKLSFINGATCVAQAGQRTEFELAEIQTPSVPGNVRIRVRKTYGATA